MSRPKLLIATGNPHKLGEYSQLLSNLPVALLSLQDVGIDRLPPETGRTFEENAIEKAVYCACTSGLLTLADDSGLEVDALDGAPGINSNRWAGPGKCDADRIRLLLERIRDVPEPRRGARFVCVVAISEPDGSTRTFKGTLEGRLTAEPRGANGFGYDPIFYVPDLERTVAQLSEQEKNEISHRARATRAAKGWLQRSLLEIG